MMSGDPFSLSTSIGGFAPQQNPNPNPNPKPNPKKKRNLPGTPDPDAEVIALSPKTLMATNRFICEICNKGFQRDQNLQLHRRGHNLPWKLRQRSNKEVRKKVYICPEKTCVHHDPSRALGDLTGIKKHFSRKHGEKKWKCDKCSKKYAVQSDWKAHTKTCGTREYKCDCGNLFSRKDSFITHRAFCDALAEESARLTSVATTNLNFKNEGNAMSSQPSLGLENNAEVISQFGSHGFRADFNGGMGTDQQRASLSMWLNQGNNNGLDVGGLYGSSSCSSGLGDRMAQMTTQANNNAFGSCNFGMPSSNSTNAGLLLSSGKRSEAMSKPASPMSATALLQKAAQMGSTRSSSNNNNNPSIFSGTLGVMSSSSNSHATTNLNDNNNTNNPQNFSSTSSAEPVLADNNFSSFTHASNSTNLDQLLMQTSAKQSEQQVQLKLYPGVSSEHNLTRDFLGMGGGGGAGGAGPPPPFLPQELAKFASIGSPMGLTQFTANH
ncbi:zinc finger protein JACKDAW [Neltuma alba]|uniref:zinc finger protein JACKDAW n=1 Tax=Neltuma alba TaxID=207710 RepID=UPI0010A47F59|nr:zinc finger protein JACKDAW-like [Prosopis alba]XP_028775223.1 zinc finger protein JACKDAW-like [Prosopis alba]